MEGTPETGWTRRLAGVERLIQLPQLADKATAELPSLVIVLCDSSPCRVLLGGQVTHTLDSELRTFCMKEGG